VLGNPGGSRQPRAPQICTSLVAGGIVSEGCSPKRGFFDRAPLTVAETVLGGGDQYATIDGLASDDVARLELFLATGERIAVPLRDNAFLVQAGLAKHPARLVAYDRRGRVVAVQTYQSPFADLGRQPAPNARWRTLIRAGSGPMRARLLIAPAQGGGTCFAFRWGVNGGGMTGCPPRRWEGPPLQVYFQEPQVRGRGPSLFLAGRGRPDIARIAVHFQDGHVLTVKPVEGYVLVSVPLNYAGPAHKGSYSVGLDRQGRQVARGSP
jgi:hypothetical protein